MAVNWQVIILCAVGIAILLTSIVMPQLIKVSLAKKLFDKPDSRKIHKGIIPRLGGLAFLPVILVTFSVIMVITGGETGISNGDISGEFPMTLPSVFVLFGSMTILFVVGLSDDLTGLKYSTKFIAQILSAALIVLSGFDITDYFGLFGIGEVSQPLGALISWFLVVYIINAINLIDGIDGLASSISVIALALFGILLYLGGEYVYSMLSWTGCATVGVFFLFNVLGRKEKHTKIFMGDIGSLTIGVFLAFIAIALGRITMHPSMGCDMIALALAPVMIPLFDVIRVFLVRIMHGKSPFLPDKNHIHHRLLASGFKAAGVLGLLVAGQLVIIAVNLAVAPVMNVNLILGIDLAVYLLIVAIAEIRIHRQPRVKKAKR